MGGSKDSGIIAEKSGRLGEAPERRKESFEWETLVPYIGADARDFSADLRMTRVQSPGATYEKSPAEAGLE